MSCKRSRRRWLLIPASLLGLLGVLLLRPYPRDQLRPRASLEIVDRHGAALYVSAAEAGGKQLWVPIGDLPPILTTMLIESEDRTFFDHAGVEPMALVRSIALNLQRGAWDFGGSTLTMQTVRLIKPHPRTVLRKGLEMIDAVRLERAIDKQQILEHYVNRAYFGGGATGIEAAAWRWFGHRATQLTEGEAALLAVVVRGPRVYDLDAHFPGAIARRDLLLERLVDGGQLTAVERDAIVRERLYVQPSRGKLGLLREAPHFVDWVMEQLSTEERRRGGRVQTTLELPLQRRCEALVRDHTAELAVRGVGQAGVVVLDAQTGEVRAMVGSRDHADARGGMINILTTPRNPGSALKPFTYAEALELGDSPSSLAADIADGESNHNADGREHGPVRYAVALPSSYNLAALDVARRVGPDRLLRRLRQAGLHTLDRVAEAYGAELTLGSGKVKLVDLAAAYRFLVHGGEVIAAHGIAAVQPAGEPLAARPAPLRTQLFSAQTSFLVMDMLADNLARRAAFGDDLPVDLPGDNAAPVRVVVKTGTSGGFADNVAVLATREYIVLAWAGNFDGPGMKKMLAMWGAAPLARRALQAAASGGAVALELTLPAPPPGVVRGPVCALSGLAPGPRCPRTLAYRDDARQDHACDWHRADGSVAWPVQYQAWAERVRRAGGRPHAE